MSKKNDCWGIEVGSNAIKAIRLVRQGNTIQVADFDVLPFKQVLTLPDTNVDEAIQLNLDQFLSRRSVAYSTVVVSVPGNAALVRFAKLPPVEPKRIPDIVKFEAVQQIPFPIDQVEWDYQVFSKPDSPDVEVGIFAIVRERLTQYLANYRAVGLNVDVVTISPLAVYNAFAYDMQLTDESPGLIFMDIGTTSTDLIIAEHGAIWPRTLPKGGNNFTDALVRSFKLSFPKAEKLKREAGTSKYARQIFQAMRPVFSELVQEMQRSLGFYQSLNRDTNLNKIVGVGSTFRLPGMQKYLKQQLQMEVVRPNGFERLKIEGKLESEFDEQALNLATAYGLALQGLGLARVEANIMPKTILKQRLWRAKQPWMAASAALFVAASGAAYTKLLVEQRDYVVKKNENQASVTKVVNTAKDLVDRWNKIQNNGLDPRLRINNLRRLLDYRNVWPDLLWDLDLAAKSLKPQPALLIPDYSVIHNISRPTRRKLYMKTVSVVYVPLFDNGSGADVDPFASGDMSGGVDSGLQGGPPTGDVGSAGPTRGTSRAPQFKITIEGETDLPHNEGSKLIVQDYINSLQEQSKKRMSRPYKILPESVQLLSFSSKPGAQSLADNPTTPDQANKKPFRAQDLFHTNPASPASTETPTPNEGILPTRPLLDEDSSGDQHFVIGLTVQLVRPEDARKTQEESAPTDEGAAPADAGAPTEVQP